jgi:chloramphenicol-sensitive protein RarD
MSTARGGYLYGLAAYGLWGFFPLYFRALAPAGALEVLAHRIVWSLAFLVLALLIAKRIGSLRMLLRRPGAVAGMTLAAVIIAVNWGTYIHGVNTERVVETSLGYFINPLVTVMLGVVVLGERLRPLQWLALGFGGAGVALLTIDYGRLPWIALVLAFSFASYGLVKKRLGLPPAEGLMIEAAVLSAPALAFIFWLDATGAMTFGALGATHTTLLVLSGAVTAVPLLLFAASANRIPLTSLGILQYIAPLLQFLIGVFVFREPMPAARFAAFVLVWMALIVFTAELIRHARRGRIAMLAAAAEGAGPIAAATGAAADSPEQTTTH